MVKKIKKRVEERKAERVVDGREIQGEGEIVGEADILEDAVRGEGEGEEWKYGNEEEMGKEEHQKLIIDVNRIVNIVNNLMRYRKLFSEL